MPRLILLITLLLALLAGCSTDVSSDILGKWHGSAGNQDLVFYQDGQLLMTSPRHGDYRGTYTLTDGNKLVCVFPKLSRPIECTAYISGNTLKLIYTSGREELYQRI